MTLITGKLVNQGGTPTRLQYVMLKNKQVRVSVDGELITGESVMIPVEEDGNIEFTAEPGPAVMVIWREGSTESLSHLVPLWIQDVPEDTLENAFRLGKEHDADVHTPSIVEIIKMTVDAKLEGYATQDWVNDAINVIELTPGDKGDKGDSVTIVSEDIDTDGNVTIEFSDGNTITIPAGTDGVDGLSAYEIWLSSGNEGTESDFLSSLKGEKGDPGEGGTGDNSQSPMRTTTGISITGDPEDISSAKPGDLRIDVYTGNIYRARGTFRLTPVDPEDIINVTEEPWGTSGVHEPGKILNYRGIYYQVTNDGVVNPVVSGNIATAQGWHNSGVVTQGRLFPLSNADQGYEAGVYIFDDAEPVTAWDLFRTSKNSDFSQTLSDLSESLSSEVSSEVSRALSEYLVDYVMTWDLEYYLSEYVKQMDLDNHLRDYVNRDDMQDELSDFVKGYELYEYLSGYLSDYVSNYELNGILTTYDNLIQSLESRIESLENPSQD